jgi:radical SAM-linked protein
MPAKVHERFISYRDLTNLLNTVEKPGRYVGGEFGSITHKPEDSDFRICIVFPDLYEIGMSNQAVRILYKLLNGRVGLHAERAFSPAPDFAKGLKDRKLNLFSLENGIPISDFDLLAVTIGYELSFTNFLSFLDSSAVPLRRSERTESHPLVIAGGPAMTNPAPWAEFLDAVFIGEAEDRTADDMLELKSLKDGGANRDALLARVSGMDGFWTPDKPEAHRVVWNGFGNDRGAPAALPIPSMIPVQDHGVIEIMRGCPNKCRFCHAGVFYRPFRQKSMERIMEEADYLVNKCGYRDITLSSLSTGDYSGLEPLVEKLNQLYTNRRVSFSLPSLRVNSITLSLIGRLGAVRKSGLTFAVETPTVEGQRGINKEVPADRVIQILKEAKREGWKLAKFYFMLGLPVDNGEDEAASIVDYLFDVQKATGINLNVNIGTFIPKPHTPFERAAQLTDEDAMERIRAIRDGLRSNKRIKVSFHSPYVSFLEGILTRGDKRSGELAYEAWKNGAGFDAWDDRMDKDAWRDAIAAADWDVEKEICRGHDESEILPWAGVSLGITAKHLAKESSRSQSGDLTIPCALKCVDHCGVCDNKCKVVIPDEKGNAEKSIIVEDVELETTWRRLLLEFRKSGPAVYLGHLDVLNVFERALQRTGFIIDFTEGFNPKPRIEFAQPLSLGLISEGEICTVKMRFNGESADKLIQQINDVMPSGIEIVKASWIGDVPPGHKTIKVMSAFWGSEWKITCRPGTDLNAGDMLTSAELAEALLKECRERGVSEDCRIETADESLRIHLRHGGTRHHNIMRLLESVLGMSALETPWEITRIKCWASNKAGKPEKYEKAFPENYESTSFLAESQ